MSNVLATLRKAGITISVDGDKVIARPKAALTDDLRGLIRANKAGLMAEIWEDWRTLQSLLR